MILAVDQGFANYGYSIWDKGEPIKVGIIQTKPHRTKKIKVSVDMIRRNEIIVSKLNQIIKKYKIHAIVGEMPGFGAKSSSAAVAMTMASAITLTLCNTHKLQTLWHTPREIKKYFTGNPDASKEDIMKEACKRHNWDITFKRVRMPNKRGEYRLDPLYHVMGKQLPKGKFEHIADAIASYHTAKYYFEKEN